MKLRIKRTISIALAIVMCAGVLCGCFGGGGGTDASNTVTFVVTASEQADTPRIIEMMQEIVLEKTGMNLEFQFVTDQSYDLTISSGEPVDLLFAPDWMNYWPNAARGAFMEITDEDLQEYAPYIWEELQSVIDTGKYKGVRYGVPNLHRYASDRCFVARGDLMDKYGIADLNSVENIEAYLTAIAKNEPDLIPFDVPGTAPWLNLAMFASDWGWCPVSSSSFGEHVYFDIDDPEPKLFIAAEQPEMLEFTERMKRWNEAGFFSKSVLSNKTSSLDSFKAGRTALAFVDSPDQCQLVWDELSADDRAAWDIRFYSRYQQRQAMYNIMNGAVAISSYSDNKEGALKVLNEFYANKELYRLLNYGIEGEHYVINDDGSYTSIDDDESKGYISTGIYNDNWALSTQLTFPGHEELVQKFKDMRFENPAIDMPKDDTNIREIQTALQEVFNQYTTPRYYGAFTGTAQETIDAELQALKAAGIDTYRDELQKQLDAYLESMGK